LTKTAGVDPIAEMTIPVRSDTHEIADIDALTTSWLVTGNTVKLTIKFYRTASV